MDETISNQQDSLPEPDGFANWSNWRKEEWRQRGTPPVLTENLTPASEAPNIPEKLVDPKSNIRKKLESFDRVARVGFAGDIMGGGPKEEELFVDPTMLTPEIKPGDTIWGILS